MWLYYLIVLGASTYIGTMLMTLISLGYDRWALNCEFCCQTFLLGMACSVALGVWYLCCWRVIEERGVHLLCTVLAMCGCMIPFCVQAFVAWVF